VDREIGEEDVKLIIQPDDGARPLIEAVRRARTAVDIVIFRLDVPELEKALAAAVERGVPVRALIAHTSKGGEKSLRRLEMRLLAAGVTVARTADDLTRYHAKMIVADDTLHVLGFNFTRLDIRRSRSFGVVTREPALVKEACALFEADRTRQPYTTSHERLVVSPENSRQALSAFIGGAKRELLIYDGKISDPRMIRLLRERLAAGVDVRIIGKAGKGLTGFGVRSLAGMRLHVRAIVRDGRSAFVGSQSLRRLELDGRREVGVLLNDPRIARRMKDVFERDWEGAAPRREKGESGEPTAVALGA
jgi:phosphatidylserine/phosphatidylglycerophosphate/cardiolipin synthase-like enzyme